MAYHALFASYVRFGIVALGAADETEGSEKIIILQKKAIRTSEPSTAFNTGTIANLVCFENKVLTVISLYIVMRHKF